MKNVYNMVTGKFIDDEPTSTSSISTSATNTSDSLSDDGYRENHLLQLQLVEAESSDKDVRMPADLAYHTFFND